MQRLPERSVNTDRTAKTLGEAEGYWSRHYSAVTLPPLVASETGPENLRGGLVYCRQSTTPA